MMPYVQTHGKIIEGRPGSQIDPDLELFRVSDRDAVLSGCLTLRQRPTCICFPRKPAMTGLAAGYVREGGWEAAGKRRNDFPANHRPKETVLGPPSGPASGLLQPARGLASREERMIRKTLLLFRRATYRDCSGNRWPPQDV
jgi:hypothetical protein